MNYHSENYSKVLIHIENKEFKGPLRIVLVQNRFVPVSKFEKVPGKVIELPEQEFNELSSDQQYLHSMSIAVQTVIIHEQLAVHSPGNYHHAPKIL